MAYTTGSASTFAALKTALVDACVAAGWTWDLGNSVLYKGTNYLYVTTPALTGGSALGILGRTALTTGGGPNACHIGPILQTALVFPVTYHAFTFANEVYFVISSGDEYQWLAFGESQQPGLLGTGMFYSGSMGSNSTTQVFMDSDNFASNYSCPGLFWQANMTNSVGKNHFVHNDIDGGGWESGSSVSGVKYATELIKTQPNSYNMESVLIPVKAFMARLDSKHSQTIECFNARHIINTHYQNEEIITLGIDKWMVFPCFKKDVAYNSSSAVATSSGVYGMAIRYEGP